MEPTQNVGEKVWGSTTPLILTPAFEMHSLVIKPWHVCSIHTHHFKHNAFYVVEGELWIDTWHHGRPNEQRLEPGQTYTVAPDVLHRFRTRYVYGHCHALEMYFPNPGGPPLSEDIFRQNEGGPLQ